MKKGFTLIELLVVIAIIGILSSLILGYFFSCEGERDIEGVCVEVEKTPAGEIHKN